MAKETQFASPEFNSENYVKELWTAQTEESVRGIYKGLLKTKADAAENLKSNVYRNYRQFVDTSKEIANLEVDMQDLRNIIGEMGATLRNLQQLSFGEQGKKPEKSHESRPPSRQKLVEEIEWLLEVPDELDELIAQRSFDQAIGLVKEVNHFLLERPVLDRALQNQEIRDDIKDRVDTLADVLCQDLSNSSLPAAQVRQAIAHLAGLRLEGRALGVFLDTRARMIALEIKRLRYEGDACSYMRELSRMVFTHISSTCEDFTSVFDNKAMHSALVSWVYRVLQQFELAARPRMFSSDDFRLIAECTHRVHFHAETLLPPSFSLTPLLHRMFLPSLLDEINSRHRHIDAQLSKQLKEDEWSGICQLVFCEASYSSESKGSVQGLHITRSAMWLNAQLREFVVGVSLLISFPLVSPTCSMLSSLLDRYLSTLRDEMSKEDLGEKEMLFMLANGVFFLEAVFPRLRDQLQKVVGCPIPGLDQLNRLVALRNASMQEVFCLRRGHELVNNQERALDWPNTDYSQRKRRVKEPSRKFQKLIKYVGSLGAEIRTVIHPDWVFPLLGCLLEQVAQGLADKKNSFWKREIGRDGLHQLVLDMKYFLLMAGRLLTDVACVAINDVMNRATTAFCEKNNKDPTNTLQPDEWYQELILAALPDAVPIL